MTSENYYTRNREERLAYQRRYGAEHYEDRLAYDRTRDATTERKARKAYNDAARRARRYGLDVAFDPVEVSQMLRAYEIASERGLEVDHRVGLSTPGSPGHRYSNLELLSRAQHIKKSVGENLAKRVVSQMLRDEDPKAPIDETNWTTISPGEDLAHMRGPEGLSDSI